MCLFLGGHGGGRRLLACSCFPSTSWCSSVLLSNFLRLPRVTALLPTALPSARGEQDETCRDLMPLIQVQLCSHSRALSLRMWLTSGPPSWPAFHQFQEGGQRDHPALRYLPLASLPFHLPKASRAPLSRPVRSWQELESPARSGLPFGIFAAGDY